MKAAFKLWCARNGFKPTFRNHYTPGMARLITHKEKFMLETSNSENAGTWVYPEGWVGFEYPLGVKPLSSSDIVKWLNDK